MSVVPKKAQTGADQGPAENSDEHAEVRLTFAGGLLIIASIGLIVFRKKRFQPQMNADVRG